MLSIFKSKKNFKCFYKCAGLLGIIVSPCFGTTPSYQPLPGFCQSLPSFLSSLENKDILTFTCPQIRKSVIEKNEFVGPLIDATWRYDYSNVMRWMRLGEKDKLNTRLEELIQMHKPAEYNAFSWWFKKAEVRMDEVFQSHVYAKTTEALMDQFRNTPETPIAEFIEMESFNAIDKNKLYVVHVLKEELSIYKAPLQNILTNHQSHVCLNVEFSNEPNGQADLSKAEVPNNLHFISVKGDRIRSIGKFFLADCIKLRGVDLSCLSNILFIEVGFLNNCKTLKSIDLIVDSSVGFVNDFLFMGCELLESVDLSFLSSARFIGSYCFTGCKSLKIIDLSPLVNVTCIWDKFFSRCDSLRSIDLSYLSNVTQVGESFFSGCRTLQSIDLSYLSNVTQVGDFFISDCDALKTVTITGSSEVIKSGVMAFKKKSHLSNLEIIDEVE